MTKLTKYLAVILVLTLSISLFAGCSQEETSGAAEATTEKATAEETKEETKTEEAKEEVVDDGKEYLLKLGYVQNDTDPLTLGLYELAKNVEERTNGKFKIEVYPSSQLGSTPDVMEQAKAGANVGCLTDAGRLSDSVSSIGVLDAPYLYDTYDEGLKIVTSDLFTGWTDELDTKYGYKVISFNWYQGARHFLTNVPVETPEDLNGLRIRTTGSPVWQATVDALGAKATALAWAEVYAGLQQKVVDGAEAQHPGTYGSRLYECVDYITKTGHFQLMTGLVVSSDYFNSLPEEYQVIFMEEGLKAGEYASNIVLDSLDELEELMIAEGITINEVDLAPWKEAAGQVYEDYPEYKELKTEIEAIIAN